MIWQKPLARFRNIGVGLVCLGATKITAVESFVQLGKIAQFSVPAWMQFLLHFWHILKGSWWFFWFKQVLDRGPEQRESKLTVLCQLIIIILISYIFIYYIIIKVLIMENHPSWNRERNSLFFCFCWHHPFFRVHGKILDWGMWLFNYCWRVNIAHVDSMSVAVTPCDW